MKTFYIDIYFLINFTVDILALYFAALFAKVNSTVSRLIISSALGSFLACFVALFKINGFLFIIILILGAILISLIFCGNVTLVRHLKFFGAFLVFETFIGGFVTYIYNVLDTYIYPNISDEMFGSENQKILILSLVVLLSYGLLKILFLVFSGTKSERNIEFKVGLFGKEIKLTALIDSGNLLCDPLSGKPIIIVKKTVLKSIINVENILESKDLNIRSRIRLIPGKGIGCQKIFTALRCDYIFFEKYNKKYESPIIALDEEEGNFGGYMALMPISMAD